MKLYVLVAIDKDGEPTLSMPTKFGRDVRAYKRAGMAKVMAERFGCAVVELDVSLGEVVWKKSSTE